jgi:hypothetical protein
MGWTVQYGGTRRGTISELTRGWEGDNNIVKCLAKQFKGNAFSGTLYAVFETTPKDCSKPSYRWIFVALMRYYPGRDGGWGYKDMDETCGPCEVSCPLKYLEMAGPLPEGDKSYAGGWRESVRKYWDERRAGAAFAKTLKVGDKFMSKKSGGVFIYQENSIHKGSIIGREEDGFASYRIKKVDIRPVPAAKLAPPSLQEQGA